MSSNHNNGKDPLGGNKLFAAFLLAGVLALFAAFFAKLIYSGAHHGHEEKCGYCIEVPQESAGGTVEEAEPIDIMALIASADAEKGKKVAKKCLSCHSLNEGDAHKTGPNLYDILGKAAGAADGYSYSKALQTCGLKWNYEELWGFLENPSKYLKGTKMNFMGVRKPEQLADLIVYLRQNSANPVALPTPAQ